MSGNVSERDERPNYVLRALDRFAEYGDREAIVGVGGYGGCRLTYTQTRALVLDMAAVLRDAGYRPGMTVAVMVAHPPEGFPLQLALHLLGCRTVWIAHASTPGEVDDIVRRIPPELFIYDTRTHAKPGAVLAARLGVPVRCLGPGGLGPDLLAPPPQGTEPFDLDTAVGAPQAVFQTTGTTGVPKAILHGAGLYEQMFTLADDWVAAGEPLLRHLILTPVWHASGQAAAVLNLISGGVFYVLWSFQPAEYFTLIEKYRATSCFLTPPQFYQLLDEPTGASADMSSMKLLTIGGSAASTARLREGIERWGPIIRIAYGMSELPYVASLAGITPDPAHPERLRSCGPPYGDVRAEIRDPDGKVLPPGETGELWVSSRQNFLGYWAAPELTAQTLVDGWLRTWDLAFADDEGYLHIVGREQDMIITGFGGFHIFPRPIEDVLTSHPEVAAAAVIKIPHEIFNEGAHAYVVRMPGATATAEELIAELSALITEKLNKLWVPHSFEFIDELPRTGFGKVDVQALRDRWAAEHHMAPVVAS